MGNEIITIPIVMSIILGLTLQLVDIAESSSDKVVKYASQMDSALDCAFKGIDIKYCAPELDSTSFKEDLNRTKELMDSMKNITISDEEF